MKTLPFEDSGPSSFWGGDSKRGAAMGRAGNNGELESYRFTLRKVPIDSGGYDTGGAYWGLGAPLYWYVSDCGNQEGYFRLESDIIARNDSACEAYWQTPQPSKAEMLKRFPDDSDYVELLYSHHSKRDRVKAIAQLRRDICNNARVKP